MDMAAATNGTNPTNLTFGDGFIGGKWPAEPHFVSGGGPGFPGYYFNGEISEITLTS
jgi:hypothetical protein